MKDYVYRISEDDTATLRARLIETIRSVADGKLTELVGQLYVVRATRGYHVDVD